MSTVPPNIICITLHDLGRNLPAYTPMYPHMPNLERMCNESVIFENHFCTSPLCSPARASIQTGRYPHCNGMNGLVHHGFTLNENEKCIPHYLNILGYHTALYGFQHETPNVNSLGYMELGRDNGCKSMYCAEIVPHVEAFLTRSHTCPFFLSIGFFETHRSFKTNSYNVPVDPEKVLMPDYLPETEETREDWADFMGSLMIVEQAIGIILDTLDRANLSDNTVLLFTSDHGEPFPRAKSTLYDPGIGVSFLVRCPGRFHGGKRIQAMTSHIDILPTILDIAGGDISGEIQGESLLNCLVGKAGNHRNHIFAEKSWHGNEYDPMRCIRTDKWKYIENYRSGWSYMLPLDIRESLSGQVVEYSRRQERPAAELYDLDSDPLEMLNLAGQGDYSEIQDELQNALHEWMKRTGDPLPNKDIPWSDSSKESFPDNKSRPLSSCKNMEILSSKRETR